MPSKKSVIRPVVLAVSALFATGVYAQNVDTKDSDGVAQNLGYYELTVRSGTSSSVLDHSSLIIQNLGDIGSINRSALDAEGLRTTGGVQASQLRVTNSVDFTNATITGLTLTGQFGCRGHAG